LGDEVDGKRADQDLTASAQIEASRDQADKMVAAAQEQTAVAQKQIETTIRLERDRVASETNAFLAMLEAAMARLLEETLWARGAMVTSVDPSDPSTICKCITKGGFDELRGGCIRLGSPLTGEFLDLEREIDNFRLAQWKPVLGLKKLAAIEAKATKLRNKTVSMRIVRGDPPDGAA
jgi:hypothetical protein